MKIEDMDIWETAVRLSVSIYRELADLRDYDFKKQITRAGLSITRNIAEGFEHASDGDTTDSLRFARRSCVELRQHTHTGIEAGYIAKDVGKLWICESDNIATMLARRNR
jgi:four helix bundle protein